MTYRYLVLLGDSCNFFIVNEDLRLQGKTAILLFYLKLSAGKEM